MTIRYKDRFAEALETCRPVAPAKPNILKTFLAVQPSFEAGFSLSVRP